jgi:hypothetical protein
MLLQPLHDGTITLRRRGVIGQQDARLRLTLLLDFQGRERTIGVKTGPLHQIQRVHVGIGFNLSREALCQQIVRRNDAALHHFRSALNEQRGRTGKAHLFLYPRIPVPRLDVRYISSDDKGQRVGMASQAMQQSTVDDNTAVW